MEDVFVQHRELEAFEDIRNGLKKMEIRLFDEKRKRLNLGQKIKVVLRGDDSKFLFTRVIGFSRFSDFDSLEKVLGDRIKDYEWDILGRVYSEERVKELGILVIHFELLD